MLAYVKEQYGSQPHLQRVFRLSSGRDLRFNGPFFSPPNHHDSFTVEIHEISSPSINADELEELAEDLKTLAAELRTQSHGIKVIGTTTAIRASLP